MCGNISYIQWEFDFRGSNRQLSQSLENKLIVIEFERQRICSDLKVGVGFSMLEVGLWKESVEIIQVKMFKICLKGNRK